MGTLVMAALRGDWLGGRWTLQQQGASQTKTLSVTCWIIFVICKGVGESVEQPCVCVEESWQWPSVSMSAVARVVSPSTRWGTGGLREGVSGCEVPLLPVIYTQGPLSPTLWNICNPWSRWPPVCLNLTTVHEECLYAKAASELRLCGVSCMGRSCSVFIFMCFPVYKLRNIIGKVIFGSCV